MSDLWLPNLAFSLQGLSRRKSFFNFGKLLISSSVDPAFGSYISTSLVLSQRIKKTKTTKKEGTSNCLKLVIQRKNFKGMLNTGFIVLEGKVQKE